MVGTEVLHTSGNTLHILGSCGGIVTAIGLRFAFQGRLSMERRVRHGEKPMWHRPKDRLDH